MKKKRKKKLNPYEWIEELDWDRFPSYGPFSDEEAIARIEKFEDDEKNGRVKWMTLEDIDAELKKRHPFLAKSERKLVLKRNMILSLMVDGIQSNVIALPVTQKDLKTGVNADHIGLYGFRGFWYKGNGTRICSYGKICDFDYCEEIKLIRNNICGLSKKQLQDILK